MKLRAVIILGIIWGLLVVGFQGIAGHRFGTQPPDNALSWTPFETSPGSLRNRLYLQEPFMNSSVAWDSEYYLSIAVAGYDDVPSGTVNYNGQFISKNYAFLPFYPVMIKILALPLRLFLSPIAAAALAGTIVSVLGAIAAAGALFLLLSKNGETDRAWKTAFYFLIFPTSFFLAQVYTEGLFLGLAFGSLALLEYRKLGWAALLAVLAVWTRSAGVCLTIPLLWSAVRAREGKRIGQIILNLLYGLAPVVAFLLWYWSPLGRNFIIVEELFFHRQPLAFRSSWREWSLAFKQIFTGVPQARAYHLIEFSAIIYGIIACSLTLKKRPALSLFGLAVIFISLTSGVSQGMQRYILAAPSVFILPARWGARSEIFDRSWTIASLLLFGMMVTAYTLNMWVG